MIAYTLKSSNVIWRRGFSLAYKAEPSLLSSNREKCLVKGSQMPVNNIPYLTVDLRFRWTTWINEVNYKNQRWRRSRFKYLFSCQQNRLCYAGTDCKRWRVSLGVQTQACLHIIISHTYSGMQTHEHPNMHTRLHTAEQALNHYQAYDAVPKTQCTICLIFSVLKVYGITQKHTYHPNFIKCKVEFFWFKPKVWDTFLWFFWRHDLPM